MRGTLLPAILVGLVTLVGVVLLLFQQIQRRDRLARRIERARRSGGQETDAAEPTLPFLLRSVSAIGSTVARSGLLSDRTLAELEHTLTVAGFRGRRGLGLFIGTKLMMLVLLPGIAWPLLQQIGLPWMPRNLVVLVMAVLGLIGPDYVVRRMRRRHLRMLERGLPDALDLLIICTEAGLSLGPAIGRVASEIRLAHTAVADELAQTANELRVTSDSRTALFNAGTRTGLDGVKRVALTLAQSIQFGTPLSQALRTLSAEMRKETLTRFEAQAGRLPVMLTVPMIVFILPCVFLVVGGPAILQLLDILKK